MTSSLNSAGRWRRSRNTEKRLVTTTSHQGSCCHAVPATVTAFKVVGLSGASWAAWRERVQNAHTWYGRDQDLCWDHDTSCDHSVFYAAVREARLGLRYLSWAAHGQHSCKGTGITKRSWTGQSLPSWAIARRNFRIGKQAASTPSVHAGTNLDSQRRSCGNCSRDSDVTELRDKQPLQLKMCNVATTWCGCSTPSLRTCWEIFTCLWRADASQPVSQATCSHESLPARSRIRNAILCFFFWCFLVFLHVCLSSEVSKCARTNWALRIVFDWIVPRGGFSCCCWHSVLSSWQSSISCTIHSAHDLTPWQSGTQSSTSKTCPEPWTRSLVADGAVGCKFN